MGCCVQGQGHSDGSDLHWVFAYLLFSAISIKQSRLILTVTLYLTVTPSTQSGKGVGEGILPRKATNRVVRTLISNVTCIG